MNFFDELRRWNAKLVFFCRPYLNRMDEKTISKAFEHAVRNSLDQFNEDQMKMGKQFACHIDKRFLYNLMQICPNYGEVYTHLNGTTFDTVQYAREHSDEVLAMIQHDMDYLLFEGKYQYWSLADLDIDQKVIKTKMYCRDTLYKRLKLNTKQSQMLSALSRLKGDFIHSLVRKIKTDEKNEIFKLADYVRNLDDLDLERIARDIFGENYSGEQLKEIQDELSRYEMPKPDNLNGRNQSFINFVEFSKTNLYFAYGLAVETESTNEALVYIDLRQQHSIDYINLMTTILMKQCGIVFKDIKDRPYSRAVKIKRTLNANDNDLNDEVIIYPPSKLKFVSHFPIWNMCLL